MTAPMPDKAWMLMDEDGDIVGYQDNRDDLEFYIRRDAFPVEEIIALIEEWEDMKLGPNGYYSMPLYGIREKTVPLLCRILSLLESDDE